MEDATVEHTGFGFVVRQGGTDDDETALVTVSRRRRLWCHHCGKGWCDHVQAVVDHDKEF